VILGLDTSTSASAACVLRADGAAFEAAPEPQALLAAPAHARDLMPAIARVMEAAQVRFDALEAIAVGVGTARALAAANELPLRPVSSLAALAAGIESELALPLIDAKRGELFAALYEDGELRWSPFVGAPDEITRRLEAAGVRPRAAGDGSVRFRGVLEAAGIRVDPDEASSHVVRALHVCRLAQRVPDAPPESVLPDYLRLPDAKPK
jgi:tRNA threonylcarbamoyladenosine biosynthesis protein TsaB